MRGRRVPGRGARVREMPREPRARRRRAGPGGVGRPCVGRWRGVVVRVREAPGSRVRGRRRAGPRCTGRWRAGPRCAGRPCVGRWRGVVVCGSARCPGAACEAEACGSGGVGAAVRGAVACGSARRPGAVCGAERAGPRVRGGRVLGSRGPGRPVAVRPAGGGPAGALVPGGSCGATRRGDGRRRGRGMVLRLSGPHPGSSRRGVDAFFIVLRPSPVIRMRIVPGPRNPRKATGWTRARPGDGIRCRCGTGKGVEMRARGRGTEEAGVPEVDVAVIGAGAAGLSLAHRLSGRVPGARTPSVVLVDAPPGPLRPRRGRGASGSPAAAASTRPCGRSGGTCGYGRPPGRRSAATSRRCATR